MTALYEINGQMAALLAKVEGCFDLETGELADEKGLGELEQAMNQLSVARNQKIEAVAAFITHMKANAAELGERVRLIQRRKKAIEGQAQRMTDYLKAEMQAADIKKVETSQFRITRARTAPALEVFDAAQIPQEYWTPQAPLLNKAAVKAAIKSGKEVPGARLGEPGESLRIS